MSRRKNLIRYLLVLCISLAPAAGPGAVEMQPMDHAAGGCPDCMPVDSAIDPGCGTETCVPDFHACGAPSCSGLVPANGLAIDYRAYRVSSRPVGAAPAGPRRAESIFRPPIA